MSSALLPQYQAACIPGPQSLISRWSQRTSGLREDEDFIMGTGVQLIRGMGVGAVKEWPISDSYNQKLLELIFKPKGLFLHISDGSELMTSQGSISVTISQSVPLLIS